MARGEAFCIEMDRNITLEEANEEFFRRPADESGKRNPLSFLCGDPRCRALAKPRVSGALYWHPDAFVDQQDAKNRRRPPYWRRIHGSEHIVGCTWVERLDSQPAPDPQDETAENFQTIDVINDATRGMVWHPEVAKRQKHNGLGKPDESVDNEPIANQDPDDGRSEPTEQIRRLRADSTRFLADIAMRYLRAPSDEARKNMPLSIKDRTSVSSFYDVCLPVFAFNPYYQKERIYRGLATVSENNNVFFINFCSKFNPEGRIRETKTRARIQYVKKRVDEDDRQLAQALKEAALSAEKIWCFFYTEIEPEVDMTYGYPRGRFIIAERDHLFMCPISRVGNTDVKG